MIWTALPLKKTSTFMVGCSSNCTIGFENPLQLKPPHPDRILSLHNLRSLGFVMEEAGITRFKAEDESEPGLYHGLIHPYNAHDLVESALKEGDASTLKSSKLDLKQPAINDGAVIQIAGFRLKLTTTVPNLMLMGQSSTLFGVVPVYLLRCLKECGFAGSTSCCTSATK